MSEVRQFHIPVTPMSIEKLTERLLKWMITFGQEWKKPRICVKNKELTFGKKLQSPLQEVYGGAQTHMSPIRT